MKLGTQEVSGFFGITDSRGLFVGVCIPLGNLMDHNCIDSIGCARVCSP
jgi:hypothetical protein